MTALTNMPAPSSPPLRELVSAAICRWLDATGTPLVIGICGSQGSGKSTLAIELVDQLGAAGKRAAILSLDDLYLPGSARSKLARDIHPLLQTRGVPLTHDVELGLKLIEGLLAGHTVSMPHFDKATDEPLPRTLWTSVEPRIDVVLFEGWCVGARPEKKSALDRPVNALERTEDKSGRWRQAVNNALSGSYARIFRKIDRLILLAAPDFDVVHGWRLQQEQALRERLAEAGSDESGLMDAAAIEHFIQHYERLTKAILAEMPSRADLVIRLDADRSVLSVKS